MEIIPCLNSPKHLHFKIFFCLLYPKILIDIILAKGKKGGLEDIFCHSGTAITPYQVNGSSATQLSRNGIEPLLTDLILIQPSFLHHYDQQKNRKANVNRY